jgi:hypothetical protein
MNGWVYLVVIWLGYRGFLQWLQFKERELRILHPPAPTWELVDEAEDHVQRQLPAPRPVPAVALLKKCEKWLVGGLVLAYVVWPVDFIPDLIPVLGMSDDAVAVLLGIARLMKR